jgi:hypothetical protein
VRLNSTASVEGDIFHRSLAIEENARFEGTSRRDDKAAEKPRPAAVPPQASTHALSAESARKLNGAPDKEATINPIQSTDVAAARLSLLTLASTQRWAGANR